METEILRKTRVMLVDSSPLTRLGILSLIQSNDLMQICAQADDAPAARQLCAETQPDIIVLDPALRRGGDGLGLLRDFARLHAPAQVLVMTEREDALSLQRAFRAGARGYISKQDEPGEVLAGLEALRRGLRFASRRVSHLLLAHLASGSISARVTNTKKRERDLSVLSGRELEVFQRIGAGVGASDLARELGLSVKTIETHRQRIKDKLELKTGADLNRHASRWVTSQTMHKRRGRSCQIT